MFEKNQKYYQALLSVDYDRWCALVSTEEQDDVQVIMESIVYDVICNNAIKNTSKQRQQEHDS